jgi:hypothetical protein
MKKTTIQIIHKIARFIRENGVCINRAKSAYGADVWVCGLLSTTVEDDGYTTSISSQNLSLTVADACGIIECRRGNIEDLNTLYDNLFESEDFNE